MKKKSTRRLFLGHSVFISTETTLFPHLNMTNIFNNIANPYDGYNLEIIDSISSFSIDHIYDKRRDSNHQKGKT